MALINEERYLQQWSFCKPSKIRIKIDLKKWRKMGKTVRERWNKSYIYLYLLKHHSTLQSSRPYIQVEKPVGISYSQNASATERLKQSLS